MEQDQQNTLEDSLKQLLAADTAPKPKCTSCEVTSADGKCPGCGAVTCNGCCHTCLVPDCMARLCTRCIRGHQKECAGKIQAQGQLTAILDLDQELDEDEPPTKEVRIED